MPGECDHLADMAGFREGKLSRPVLHEGMNTAIRIQKKMRDREQTTKLKTPPRYDRSTSEDTVLCVCGNAEILPICMPIKVEST